MGFTRDFDEVFRSEGIRVIKACGVPKLGTEVAAVTTP
jgi:hypothetical protein